MPDTAVIHPKFHHFNLKTTRLQEMIDWYSTLVGAEVLFQDDVGAWLSNDAANHRIALLAFPGFTDDPEKDTRTGLHHSAFEYDSFAELNASFLRLRAAGIEPHLRLTAAYSDGERLYAIRYATDAYAPTLYAAELREAGGRSLVSEPFDRDGCAWQAIPPGSFVTLSHQGMAVKPFEPTFSA